MNDTQDRIKVDDDVIWTSPATGQEIKVNYRGAHNGYAIIWTGTMQLAVPMDQIRRTVAEVAL